MLREIIKDIEDVDGDYNHQEYALYLLLLVNLELLK
jgi:hypothetical protein